jgi:hypothetical protein
MVVLAEPPEDFNAVAVGEQDIEEERVGAAGVGVRAQFRGGPAQGNRIAFALEDEAERTADVFFVVEDQDPGHEWSVSRICH